MGRPPFDISGGCERPRHGCTSWVRSCGPPFAWNHGVIMRAGGEGLAAYLGAELTGNESYTLEPVSPVPSLLATAGAFALLWQLLRGLRHR
jgi:hypothetical protein